MIRRALADRYATARVLETDEVRSSWPEPDPRDLLKPYSSELMTMWPISTRVNSPANDGPDLLDPLL